MIRLEIMEMVPANNISGIEIQERQYEGKHVIILFFIKPSDKNADAYMKYFNYWHKLSGDCCNIYLVGYSKAFGSEYNDAIKVMDIEGKQLEYSDMCFIEVCRQLESRLTNWYYSGEPEMIILQNSQNNNRCVMDFSYYNCIEIDYGIEKKYIDSFPRFMERLLRACRSEINSKQAIKKSCLWRITPKSIVELTLSECEKLPKPIRRILGDAMFYKSSSSKIA